MAHCTESKILMLLPECEILMLLSASFWLKAYNWVVFQTPCNSLLCPIHSYYIPITAFYDAFYQLHRCVLLLVCLGREPGLAASLWVSNLVVGHFSCCWPRTVQVLRVNDFNQHGPTTQNVIGLPLGLPQSPTGSKTPSGLDAFMQ
jgi:hypothetical protein